MCDSFQRKPVQKIQLSLILGILILGTGCSSRGQQAQSNPQPSQQITASIIQLDDFSTEEASEAITSESPTPANTATEKAVTPTPDERPLPDSWSSWPVLPTITDRAREIYQDGLAMGTDPYVFSIIGDCQSYPEVFMGIYGSDRYILGDDFEYLEDTIEHFSGNFQRDHLSVIGGLSVASAFSPLWADPEVCDPGESPIDCEFRIYHPSIVFINLGTSWKNAATDVHEEWMRQIVDYVIDHGAVPILSTKGDNQEGDHSINKSIVRIAYDYDIPLWNYWSAIQYLPNHGLDDESPGGNYLTVDAWNVRNFTGLRVLDRVWRFLNEETN